MIFKKTIICIAVFLVIFLCFSPVYGKDAKDWFEEGCDFFQQEKYGDALACFNKVTELYPGNGDAWFFKGACLFFGGRVDDSLIAIDRSLEINPGDGEAWYFKGYILYMSGKFKDALLCFDKSVEIDPANTEAQVMKKSLEALLQQTAVTSAEKPRVNAGKIVYAPVKPEFVYSTNQNTRSFELKSIRYPGLYIMNLDGTEKKQLSSETAPVLNPFSWNDTYKQEIKSVEFSPDGQWITFIKEGSLRIIKPDGSNDKILAEMLFLKDGSDYKWENYSWSPGGQKIAYTNKGALYTVNPDGSDAKKIAVTGYYDDSNTYIWNDYKWSPDGKKIAFVKDGGLHAVNFDGTGLSELQEKVAFPVSKYSFSPDSSLMVYYNGTINVKRISDGTLMGIWSPEIGGGKIQDVMFMPCNNKKLLVQTKFEYSIIKYYVLELMDGKQDMGGKKIVEVDWASTYMWPSSFDCSPLEEKILFFSPKGLTSINSNGSNMAVLGDTCNCLLHPWIIFSPDGKKIFSNSLYIVNIDGKNKVIMTEDPDFIRGRGAGSIEWSPDSSKVAFAEWWGPVQVSSSIHEEYTSPYRANKIYICNSDGTDLYAVTLEEQINSYDIYWE